MHARGSVVVLDNLALLGQRTNPFCRGGNMAVKDSPDQ